MIYFIPVFLALYALWLYYINRDPAKAERIIFIWKVVGAIFILAVAISLL